MIPLMKEIFVKRNSASNLRKPSELVRPKVHSVFHGKESISYLTISCLKCKIKLKLVKTY